MYLEQFVPTTLNEPKYVFVTKTLEVTLRLEFMASVATPVGHCVLGCYQEISQYPLIRPGILGGYNSRLRWREACYS